MGAFGACARLDEIIVFRQLTKGEVKEIADIMLREVFHRAEVKGITIDVTERFKVHRGPSHCAHPPVGGLCPAVAPAHAGASAHRALDNHHGLSCCHCGAS